MEKNKSIDGLSSRRSKKAATPTTVKKAPTTKKFTKTTKPVKIPIEENPLVEEVETRPKINVTEDFLKPTQVFDFDEKSGELKAAKNIKEEKNKDKKPKKQKKPMSKKRKIILWIVSIILILLIGGGITFIIWGNDIIAKITGGQSNIFDLIFVDETYEPLKTGTNGRTNILAFGTSGYNMAGDEDDGTHDGAQLTDSIMVISLDQDTGDVVMLSLPRDLKASPTCTATGKINEVYWCNNMSGEDEQAGAEALMTEVGDILGLDFQYYAHVNWESLIQIVDTLGGINITLDENISDYYYTGAEFEAGVTYTINGEQALGLARARHGTTGGDFSRGASQQKILIGIKDKALEKNLSIAELLSLASTLGDNLRTNFSFEEMRTLAHLSSDLDFDSMRQVSLIDPIRFMTTGSIDGISYVLPSAGVSNYGAIQEYVAKMFSSDPRVYEDASILALNGTDEAGIASAEQALLEESGYQNVYADNAPEGEYAEEYTLYAISTSAPGTKALLEKKYHTTAKTLEDLPEGIDPNYDFILIIGSAE